MDNAGKVISKAEVTETLIRNIVSDQEEFKLIKSNLRHGEKDRLINAMISYPLLDFDFDENEPTLRTAFVVFKRISDSLVALGTEAAIEGILNNLPQNNNELTEGVSNGQEK